jgi:hypothetical protein
MARKRQGVRSETRPWLSRYLGVTALVSSSSSCRICDPVLGFLRRSWSQHDWIYRADAALVLGEEMKPREWRIWGSMDFDDELAVSGPPLPPGSEVLVREFQPGASITRDELMAAAVKIAKPANGSYFIPGSAIQALVDELWPDASTVTDGEKKNG